MKRIELKINTKTKKYSVIVGSNILKNFNKIFSKKKIIFEKSLIIIDKNVPNLLKKKLINNLKSQKKILYIFNANEKNKNFKSVRTIHQLLFKNKFNREDCIISFGGGITGDVAGFASSTPVHGDSCGAIASRAGHLIVCGPCCLELGWPRGIASSTTSSRSCPCACVEGTAGVSTYTVSVPLSRQEALALGECTRAPSTSAADVVCASIARGNRVVGRLASDAPNVSAQNTWQ